MTHTGPMPDSAGEFDKGKLTDETCPRCSAKQVREYKWEASDGGYEDYKYICGACGHFWWVDGIDS